MKKLYLCILYTLILFSILGCQTVSKKIDDTTTQERKELTKWLNKSESELKNFYGQPDKIEFLESRNRNYVYVRGTPNKETCGPQVGDEPEDLAAAEKLCLPEYRQFNENNFVDAREKKEQQRNKNELDAF